MDILVKKHVVKEIHWLFHKFDASGKDTSLLPATDYIKKVKDITVELESVSGKLSQPEIDETVIEVCPDDFCTYFSSILSYC